MAFTCPVCGKVSYHPMDEAEGYCGKCHRFTGAAIASLVMTAKKPDPQPEPETVSLTIEPHTPTEVAPGVTITLHRDHPTSVTVERAAAAAEPGA
jgi:hypothetical protein